MWEEDIPAENSATQHDGVVEGVDGPSLAGLTVLDVLMTPTDSEPE